MNDHCEICGATEGLVVDDDPRGGGGTLCADCKGALEDFDYDVPRLKRAGEFLKRFERRPGSTADDNDWVQRIDPELRRRALGEDEQ